MQHIVRSFEWKWDRNTCIAWFHATFTDGSKAAVGIPLAHVVATFIATANAHGVAFPTDVGDDLESVDGLGSWVKKGVKSIGKAAKGVVKAASKTLSKTASMAAIVVRSKYTTALLGAVAVAIPAVGAPALAAQLAAKRALDAYDSAKGIAKAVQGGAKQTYQMARAIQHGANIQKSVRQLVRSNSPIARMSVAALKSLPARRM